MLNFRILSVLTLTLIATASFGQTTAGPTPEQLYERGMNGMTGAGQSRNELNATEYLHRSADLGYVPAQVVLGYLYETGTILTREPQQAADWYRKAAEQDDVLGEALLGRIIFSGEATARDLNEAEKWLQKAASHEDPFSEYLLGMIRLERSDYGQAAAWFQKAANQGLPQAQGQLGQLLKRGKGVNMNKFEAYTWLLVSFDAGNAGAASDLQELEADLGSNQVEKAKSAARERERSVARDVVARGCTGWAGEFDALPAPPPPDLQRFCR
jgi:TPR repeat protein